MKKTLALSFLFAFVFAISSPIMASDLTQEPEKKEQKCDKKKKSECKKEKKCCSEKKSGECSKKKAEKKG